MAAKVPPTTELGRRFLDPPAASATPKFLQELITKHLRYFWANVFGYRPGKREPSFEDHFTLLDLAANSGHNLGPKYTPSALRAIRRISIHRVFDVLDQFTHSAEIQDFVNAFRVGTNNCFVSTNWDVVIENHVDKSAKGDQFNYGIDGLYLGGSPAAANGLSIIKLHGSSNWHYCDCCRQVVFGVPGTGKTALLRLVFIEPEDFRRLGEPPEVISEITATKREADRPVCPTCDFELTARVATFSYSKAFDYFQFRASWEAALRRLMGAHTWLFIGYSLPEADFELRHLLKTAQLASDGDGAKTIHVVLKDDPQAADRYYRFFGIKDDAVWDKGFEAWVMQHRKEWEVNPRKSDPH